MASIAWSASSSKKVLDPVKIAFGAYGAGNASRLYSSSSTVTITCRIFTALSPIENCLSIPDELNDRIIEHATSMSLTSKNLLRRLSQSGLVSVESV